MCIRDRVTPTDATVDNLHFGSGWAQAQCGSIGGCVTVVWDTNEDDDKGQGFEFFTSCLSRSPVLGNPTLADDDDNFTTDVVPIRPKQFLSTCDATTQVMIPAPGLDGCAEQGTIPDPYVIQVIHNGINLGFFYEAEFGTAAGPTVTVPAANHWVEYILYYDPTGSTLISPFFGQFHAADRSNTAELMQKVSYTGQYTIGDAVDLVGNDNLSVSLGNDCWTDLHLDDLLENFITSAGVFPGADGIFGTADDVVTNNDTNFGFLLATGYRIRITPKEGGSAIVSNSGAFSDIYSNVVVQVTEGEFDYRVEDQCGNVVGGSIRVTDFQGPVCPGTNVQIVKCEDPALEQPAFKDCSGVDESSITFDEAILGDGCGCFTAAERDMICLLYTSPSPRDATLSRMPSSA